MYKNILIAFFLFIFPALISAQNLELTGTVKDSITAEALIGANLRIISVRDTTKVTGTTTDINGHFSLALQAGAYKLQVSYIGYKTHEQFLRLTEPRNLGVIALSEKATLLKAAEIKEKAPPAIQKGDTTEFNAESFKVNPDANAENLVEKMPGVVLQNGKVQAQGEDVKQVLVDGKPFFGDDPNAALKNLPAEVISKIQIFDQQSEQSQFTGFNDGETKKTLNIITKPEFRNGTFGKIYGAGGTGETYNAGVVVNHFDNDQRLTVLGQANDVNQQNFAAEDLAGVMSGGNSRRGGGGPPSGGGNGGRGRPGGNGAASDVGDFLVDQQEGITTTQAFGLNYSDKWGTKTQVSGSYFFNRTGNDAATNLLRQYVLEEDSNQVYRENSLSNSTNSNHRFNFRLNYTLDSNNSILIRPKFTLQQNSGNSLLLGETQQSETFLNSTSSNFSSDLTAWNFSNSILWRHKFTKTGRTFSLGLDQDLKNTSGESYLNAENLYFSQGLFDTLNQYSELSKYTQTYSGNAMYTEPVGKNGQLQLNYRSSFSFNNSNKETYDLAIPSEINNVMDTMLSSKFGSHYSSQEVGTGYRFNKNKLMLMTRLSYQWSQLQSTQTFPYQTDVNQPFSSILPNGFLRYKITDRKNLMVGYRTHTSEPSIDQLQEVVNNSNPLQLSTGNPNLVQQYQHNLFSRYSATNSDKGTMFFLMLGGAYTQNYIGKSTLVASHDTITEEGISLPAGTQLTLPVNLDGYFNLRSFATIGIPLKKLKSNLNLNLSASVTRTPGLINDALNYAYSPTAGVGAFLTSNLSSKLDFTVGTNSSFSYASNSLSSSLNTKYLNQSSKVRLYWSFWKDLVYRTELNHQLYSGLSSGYDDSYFLWNMSLGIKLFKQKQGELGFSVYDLLKQNNSISRNVTETYIQDMETEVLQRYAMLTFTYNFKKFEAKK